MPVPRKKTIVLMILVLGLSVPGKGQASIEETLPMYHWSYRLLDELRLRGYFSDLFILNLPFTRGEIARSLLTLRTEIASGQTQISSAEISIINRLDAEFGPEIQELTGASLPYDLKIGLTGHLDIVHRTQDLEAGDVLMHYGLIPGHGGTNVREAIRSKLGVGVKDRLTAYYSLRWDRNLTDDPRFLGKKFQGNAAFTEQAYVQGRHGTLSFKLGRDYLSFGSGKSGHLLLSDNSRTFDMYRADFTTSIVKFTAFGIQLDDMPLDTVVVRGRGPVNTAKRFINGHRLDIRFGRWALFGAAELVLYGGPQRNFELAYVNPVNFYHGVTLNDEETLGRPGNTLGAFDFVAFPVRDVEVFGELLIDDIKIQKVNQSDLEPNKLGYLFGAQYADPFGLEGFKLRTEYARITNRAYNVFFNEWEQYLHRRRPIAYFLGNNFDRLEVGGSGWGANRMFMEARYEYIRQGEDNIDSPYNTDYLAVPDVSLGYDEPFPFGTVQRTHAFNLTLRIMASHDIHLQTELRLAHVENFAFIPGNDRNQLQLLRFGVFFNHDLFFEWAE